MLPRQPHGVNSRHTQERQSETGGRTISLLRSASICETAGAAGRLVVDLLPIGLHLWGKTRNDLGAAWADGDSKPPLNMMTTVAPDNRFRGAFMSPVRPIRRHSEVAPRIKFQVTTHGDLD